MATARKSAAATKTPAKAGAVVPIKKASGAVVSIQEQLRKQAAEMADRVAPASGIMIQPSAKGLKLPDGQTVDELNLVVVDFTSFNAFYEGAFDKDNISPPACFALGSNPKALVPSDNSPVKQSDACTGCPMNEFGSNGAGKACKNQRLLAVLPPDADDEAPIWLLKVSPTALKNFDGYVRGVASAFQAPPIAVVTKVALDPNVDYPKLTFSDPQPNENLAVHFARQEEARTLLTTEPDVSQYQAPAGRQPAKAPARKVANARR